MVQVLDFELQRQLVPYMKDMVPLPGIYDPNYIAANQDARADNIVKGSRSQQLDQIRQHIRQFKADNAVDQVGTWSLVYNSTSVSCCCWWDLGCPHRERNMVHCPSQVRYRQ